MPKGLIYVFFVVLALMVFMTWRASVKTNATVVTCSKELKDGKDIK